MCKIIKPLFIFAVLSAFLFTACNVPLLQNKTDNGDSDFLINDPDGREIPIEPIAGINRGAGSLYSLQLGEINKNSIPNYFDIVTRNEYDYTQPANFTWDQVTSSEIDADNNGDKEMEFNTSSNTAWSGGIFYTYKPRKWTGVTSIQIMARMGCQWTYSRNDDLVHVQLYDETAQVVTKDWHVNASSSANTWVWGTVDEIVTGLDATHTYAIRLFAYERWSSQRAICRWEYVYVVSSDVTEADEDFSGGLPAGWSITNNGTGNQWYFYSYYQRMQVRYSSSSYTEDSKLITKSYDFTNYNSVKLTFWERWRGGYSSFWSDGYVYVSTDGGSNWQLVSHLHHCDSNSPDVTLEGIQEIDLSPFVIGESNVKIAWRYRGRYDWYWYIDDVNISGNIKDSANSSTDVAMYGFCEGSGTTANDATINKNNGILHGATWIDGKIGKGLNFDGVNDWVEIPHDSVLTPSNEITVEAWVKKDDLGDGGIIGKYDNYAEYSYCLWWENGALHFEVGSQNYFETKVTYYGNGTGVWYHIVGTYDGYYVKLYVNGICRDSAAETRAMGIGGSPLCIGNVRYNGVSTHSYNETDACFDGIIDEVHIYNNALSAEEISSLYNVDNPNPGRVYRAKSFIQGQENTDSSNKYYKEKNGLVVIEAENYNYYYNRDDTEYSWYEQEDVSGYSGRGYLYAGPNNGNVEMQSTDGAAIAYKIYVTSAGDYYWALRRYFTNSADNTIFFGTDDGGEGWYCMSMTNDYGKWYWDPAWSSTLRLFFTGGVEYFLPGKM